jgi:23S rRNA (adenine2503-C2)-methyltransferase
MLNPAVKGKPDQLIRLDAATSPGDSRAALFGLDAAALAARMTGAGEPAWRGRQLAQAIYRQRVAELDGITTLPKSLRQRLAAEGWRVDRPRIAQVFQSADGTERYLVQCPGQNAETVEAVWMPEGDDGESGDGSDADSQEKPGAPGASPLGTWDSNQAQSLGAPSIPRSPAEWVDVHEPQSRTPSSCHPERAQRVEGPAVLPSAAGAPGLDSETGESDKPHSGAPTGKTWTRATICVSSQVGCAVNCQFCLTAKLGLQRSLTAGEIAGQVIEVFARQGVEVGRDRVNLVFMGMGEPFLNYENFMAAVRLLVEEVGLSPQRMTVSTSGIVPGIEWFAQEPPEVRPKLAISLNAPNDAIRGEIMPINRKWPIEAVMDAVRGVKLRSRERITFEYVLLGGVTDQPEHAVQVARLVRRSGLPAKVNLIAWNPGPGIGYTMPQPEAVEAFRSTLAGEGIPTYLRKPRGRDIYAACGQLKRTVEG